MHSHDSSRRRLLGGSILALAGLTLACSRSGAAASAAADGAAAAPKAPPPKVRIAEFDRQGKRLRTVELPKVVKSLEEWKRTLPPRSFHVTRKAGTEPAFSGAYDKLSARGLFH